MTLPPSNVVLCRPSHLLYLCERIRDDEREQYMALSFTDTYDAEEAALVFANKGGMKFTVLDSDGFPAAAGGYEEVAPGVWQSWMVGTPDGWRREWRAMTKATRWLIDGLFQMGARRLQTNTLADRADAIRWYEKGLGLTYEGTLRGYGKGGEDVAQFARLRETD